MEYITQRLKLKDVYPDRAKEIAKRYKKKVDDIEFIRKGVTPSEIKTAPEENAIISYITTKTKDRDNEIVDPQGAILSDYRKNPVVLWGHNYTARELPLGMNIWIKQDEKGLIAKTKYYIKDDFARRVYEYRKDGFPLAESIGFIPLDWEDYDEKKSVENGGARRKYTKWLLLEYSDVVVPSNPDAVAIAMKQGLVTEEQAKEITEIELPEEEVEESIEITCAGHDENAYKEPDELDEPVTEESSEVEEEVIEKETEEPEPEETNEPEKYSIKEVYEILKENEQLKKDIEQLQKQNEELHIKAGAVLNSKNKSNLKQAQELIQTVLDSAEPAEEEKSIDSNDLDVIELEESEAVEIELPEEQPEEKPKQVIEVDDYDKFLEGLIRDTSEVLKGNKSEKLFDDYKEQTLTDRKKAMGKVL